MNRQPIIYIPPVNEIPLEVIPYEKPEQPKLQHAATLSNLWNIWVGLKGGIAPKTRANMDHIGRRLCKFFENAHMDGTDHRLDPQGVTAWMQHLIDHRSPFRNAKPSSPITINDINTRVRSFLKWLKRMHYINEDLHECIPELIEPAPVDPAIITEEEFLRIKEFCKGRPHYQTHLWLCILAYRTGMSLIDCCHLRWRDVHIAVNGPCYIEIRRIKTARFGEKAKCQIPIVPLSDIHKWLLYLKTVPPWKRADGIEDYVHRETPALYITTFGAIRQDFKKIFAAARVGPGKTFRHFRNSMVSNMVNSGMQLALVCKVTGHNSLATMMRYLKYEHRALYDGIVKAQQYAAMQAGSNNGSDGIEMEDSSYL